MKNWRAKRDGSFNVNLTPAIDVTFLLLIFFVVATRFAAPEGVLSTRMPQEQGVLETTPLPISPIRIRLTQISDGYAVAVDNWRSQPGSFSELTTLLEDIQRRPGFDAETPVIIFAGDDVEWDHVTNCFNAVRRAHHAGVAGEPFRHITFGSGTPS
jgi:biopolymer transport protein ExbD